jgi:hypothetical protein
MNQSDVLEHERQWVTLEQETRDLCSGFEPVEADISVPRVRRANHGVQLMDPEWGNSVRIERA